MTLVTDFSPLSSGLGLGSPSPAPSPECPAERRMDRAMRPPRGLYLPQGPISRATFDGILPPKGGRTAAQKLGIAYEQKVVDCLEAIYGDNFTHSVPILYEDRRGTHRCIPDGLLRIGEDLVIVEIKLRHCDRAAWQLRRLYEPVLRQMVVPRTRRVLCAEICRSYDPDEQFSFPHMVETSLHKLRSSHIGVLQWRL